MEKNKIVITISGTTMTGKSCISLLLKKYLSETGFEIQYTYDDANLEQPPIAIETIKDRTIIQFEQQQLKTITPCK